MVLQYKHYLCLQYLALTWHRCCDQQFDLTLLFLHGLLQVFKEEPLHVADHLPEEGQRGRDGVHAPFTGSPHKIHDQAHLKGGEMMMRRINRTDDKYKGTGEGSW